MNAIIDPAALPVWSGGALICTARREETHDTASFTLEPERPARFAFKPGQFVIVSTNIGGERLHRAYSISSSPSRDDAITITVRRLHGGRVSNHLLDHLYPGGRLDASAPAGDFTLAESDLDQRLVMLCAGSGITPIMAMLRWALEHRPDADIHVIYSARSAGDIIFSDELFALRERHPGLRLNLFLDAADDRLAAQAGRATPKRLDALVSDVTSGLFFLCGNPSYMGMVDEWYRSRGGSADRFRQESFSTDPAEGDDDSAEAEDGGQVFIFSMPSFGVQTEIRAGQTLLEIMEPNAVPIVAACRSGVCGSCKCKVTEGEVERVSTATLTPEEVEQGYALACSTRAKGNVTVELAF